MAERPQFDQRTFLRLRQNAGLSEDQVAQRLKTTNHRTFTRIIRGETLKPWPATVKEIADVLGVEASVLWTNTDPEHSSAATTDPLTPEQAAVPPASTEPTPDPDLLCYDPWNPATPPAFVGRTDLLRALESAALDGRGISLVGERRMGKTSLLLTWTERATALGWPVRRLSGEGPEAEGHQALVARVIEGEAPAPAVGRESEAHPAAQPRLQHHQEADPAPDPMPNPESPDAAADRLDAWCRAQAISNPTGGPTGGSPRRPLLLLDEAEAFLIRADPRFLERLRGLVTARRLGLVLATGRTLDQVYQDLGRTSPFPNLLELRRIGLLDPTAARALIARGAPHWQTDDPDWLLDWAGPHPFYLTLLARRLLEARRAGAPRDQALDAFRDEAATQLQLWWAMLDARTREQMQRAARGEAIVESYRLRARGLLTDANRPFGQVVTAWLNETM